MTGREGQGISAGFLLVVVSLLAAAGWVFSKEALAAMPPLFFLATRFLASSLIVGAWDPGALRALGRRRTARALGTGVLLGLQTLLWVLALHHAEHIGIGAFLSSLGFVLIPVVGLAFGMRPGPASWLALAIAVPGLALLSVDAMAEDGGAGFGLSESLFLCSAVVYALYCNVNGRYSATMSAVSLTALQLASAGGVTLVASLVFEPLPDASAVSVLGWVAASILIATSLRFFLLVRALALAPAGLGALTLMLEPVWVALLGALWFGESTSPWQMAGCGLIFCALLVNALGGGLKRLRRQRAEPVRRR